MALKVNQVQTEKGADVASAAALTLGTDGNYFDVTGTTTITSIAALGGEPGTVVTLRFTGILTLTHHATDLILPTGANITTAVGDQAQFTEYAAGDWRCTYYTRADGTALVGANSAGDQPALQMGRSTNQTCTGTPVEMTFDSTDTENDPAVLEHDNTNTQRALIHTTGLHFLSMNLIVENTSSSQDRTLDIELRVDGTPVVTLNILIDKGSNNAITRWIAVSLTAGTYVTLAFSQTASSGDLDMLAPTKFVIVRATGEKGDEGTGRQLNNTFVTFEIFSPSTSPTWDNYHQWEWQGSTVMGTISQIAVQYFVVTSNPGTFSFRVVDRDNSDALIGEATGLSAGGTTLDDIVSAPLTLTPGNISSGQATWAVEMTTTALTPLVWWQSWTIWYT